MRKWVKGFTYKPKIPAVLNGTVRQTIRQVKKRRVDVGDQITFHGWEDRPYRSPWSWRMTVTVKECFTVMILDGGMVLFDGKLRPWNGEWCNELARLDGIDPPTGIELRDLLLKWAKPGAIFEVIRW